MAFGFSIHNILMCLHSILNTSTALAIPSGALEWIDIALHWSSEQHRCFFKISRSANYLRLSWHNLAISASLSDILPFLENDSNLTSLYSFRHLHSIPSFIPNATDASRIIMLFLLYHLDGTNIVFTAKGIALRDCLSPCMFYPFPSWYYLNILWTFLVACHLPPAQLRMILLGHQCTPGDLGHKS